MDEELVGRRNGFFRFSDAATGECRVDEVSDHPGIDVFTRPCVVVVAFVLVEAVEQLLFAVERIELFQTFEFPFPHMMRPVTRTAGEEHWARRDQGSVVDGAVVEMKEWCVFADAAALVVSREHDGRSRHLDSIVEGGKVVGLRRATGFARAADAACVDVLPSQEIVEHLDAVVDLQAEDA